MQKNNHVIAKVRPQLVRRRVQVAIPTSISVVVKPSRAQAINVADLKRATARPTPPPAQTPPPQIRKAAAPAPPSRGAASAVSRQQLIKQRRTKTTQVKYLTPDAAPESLGRINRLRNAGRGKILIIVGNGPSITEADLGKLRNNPKIEIMTVNKPDHRVWPTTYWTFFDSSQLRRNEDLWNAYDGIVFNSTAIKRQKSSSMQFKNVAGKGWSRDLTKGIHIGRSSVFASMQIGSWLNHEHVYVFGCDMDPNGLDGKLHFYGDNPDVDPEVRRSRFGKEAEYYDHAANLMSAEEKLRFTFCSDYNSWPFVQKFNHMSHKTAVDHILLHASRL